VARALAAEWAWSRISIWFPSASTETKAGLSARTASATRRAVVESGNEPRSRTVSSTSVPSESGAPMTSLLGARPRVRD
jgi:hypothetical protein